MISFFSNRLNHHQAPLADCMYDLCDGDFRFVELCPPDVQSSKGSSVDYSSRPYLVQAWHSDGEYNEAKELALKSDVAVFGANSLRLEVLRSRNSDSLSFELSERWLKRGLINALSPRFISYQWFYHTLFYRKPVYKLCASAYCANDQYLFNSFKGKCFKWGYYVDGASCSGPIPSSFDCGRVKLIWCARFVPMKHPELPIKLARRLKSKGIPFVLSMYGDGFLKAKMERKAEKLSLNDVVFFHGNQENETVIKDMCKHDVFLFTSDRREGWGAVVNEAMSCGCAVVAGNEIGSVPFMIKHRLNGCIFNNKDINSLEREVSWLIENPERLGVIRQNSKDYYNELWTPRHAAESLLQLIRDLKTGNRTSIVEGPCGEAVPIKPMK